MGRSLRRFFRHFDVELVHRATRIYGEYKTPGAKLSDRLINTATHLIYTPFKTLYDSYDEYQEVRRENLSRLTKKFDD